MTDRRHFIDLADVPAADLRLILDAAVRIKAARAGLARGALDADQVLTGTALALVFSKPSTRTRLSFDMAARQAGGYAMSLENSQMGRGETPADTARVLGRMVDVVAARLGDHGELLAMAETGDVSVINALTDRSHPCQLMADVMTIEEHLGPIKGRHVAWVGDGNNVLTSLVEAGVQFGFKVTVAAPDGYLPDASVRAWSEGQGYPVAVYPDPEQAVRGADVVMTDTWVSMGDQDADARYAALEPYRVNDALMTAAGPQAHFMHCLPAHRGDEVTDSVMDSSRSLVWDTAENRLHVQKAIMAWCLHRL